MPQTCANVPFESDRSPKKREALIDSLLTREEFLDIWIMKWAELLQIRTVNGLGERAECPEKRFSQRLHVSPRLGGEQHHLQQLVVAQHIRPGVLKPLAQPHQMAMKMWRLGRLILRIAVFSRHRRQPCRVGQFLQPGIVRGWSLTGLLKQWIGRAWLARARRSFRSENSVPASKCTLISDRRSALSADVGGPGIDQYEDNAI